MSSNKTQNYQLHSWEKDDRFLMDEMNENFEKLDGAVKTETSAVRGALDEAVQKVNTTLEGKADKTTVANLQTAVNSKEDKSTVAALQAALEGKAEVMIGAYNGSAVSGYEVTLGRRPLAIHFERTNGGRSLNEVYGGLFTVQTPGDLEFTDTGFILNTNTGLNSKAAHIYIAFFQA